MPGGVKKTISWGIFLLLQCALVNAGVVTLKQADIIGQSSFNSEGNWSESSRPDSSGDYVVEGDLEYFLRTPNSPESFVFGGNSLTLSGATLLLKATQAATFTFNGTGLLLNGGGIRNANNPFGTLATIAGTVTIGPKGGYLLMNDGCIDFTAALTVNGVLSFQNREWVGPKFFGPVTFGPEGKIAAGSASLVQTTKGIFVFDIGAPESTYLTGAGGLLKGTFKFKLGPEDLVPGNRWKIVGTNKKEFLDSFAVEGFQESGGVWTSGDGKYRFSENTGYLYVIEGAKPETIGQTQVEKPAKQTEVEKPAIKPAIPEPVKEPAMADVTPASAPGASRLVFWLICAFGVLVTIGLGVLIRMLIHSLKK